MKRNLASNRRERGQSLVEVALFLPIFLVILAGLIEVSQLVITQNRVSQAARVSSRFGATGGQDEGMVIVALNSVTQTLGMADDEWDMWVVRGQVSDDGTAINASTWEFTHAYGISNTVRYDRIDESAIQAEILADLQKDINPTDYDEEVGGIRFVGLYALHDVESILGLDAVPYLTDLYTIRGFSYMRQTGETAVVTNGCDAFPVTISHLARSVTPPGQAPNPYPDASDFTGPSNPPEYTDFPYHHPDVPLVNAQEGDLFYVFEGYGAGNFGWITWNEGVAGDANTLNESMAWPGNSKDYTDHGDVSIFPATPLYPWIVRGYVNPYDTSDLSMNIGDYVWANTGVSNSNALRTTLNGHIDLDRQIRLIIWDDATDTGSNGKYRIYGFAVFKLHGYSLQHGWILAEFIRWDTSCGQEMP
ncbi:MAG: pilus assembly protein [Anaerolineales bacterium]|nr:pilus assembly protein [Anaerolineales bacterium]